MSSPRKELMFESKYNTLSAATPIADDTSSAATPKVDNTLEINLLGELNHEQQMYLNELKVLHDTQHNSVIRAGYHIVDGRPIKLSHSCIRFTAKEAKPENPGVTKFAVLSDFIDSGAYGEVYKSTRTLRFFAPVSAGGSLARALTSEKGTITAEDKKEEKARIIKTMNVGNVSTRRMKMALTENLLMKELPDYYHAKNLVHDDSIKSDIIISRFFKGRELGKILKDPNYNWSFDMKVKVALNLLKAIKQLHAAKILHRDIKPENFIVDEKTGEVRIVDLGLSSVESHDTTGEGLGTPLYIGPETWRRQNVSYTSDVFQAGRLLWQIFTDDHVLNEVFPAPDILETDTPRQIRCKKAQHKETLIRLSNAFMPSAEDLFKERLTDPVDGVKYNDLYTILKKMNNPDMNTRISIDETIAEVEALQQRHCNVSVASDVSSAAAAAAPAPSMRPGC